MVAGGGDQVHPAGDEVAMRRVHTIALVAAEGVDAAAGGMSEDDDVLDLQRPDGELDGGRGAVVVGVGLVGGHEVRDVADHDHLPGIGVEDDLGRDAAVHAGDHQDARVLPGLGELGVVVALAPEARVAEAPVALHEAGGQGGGWLRLAGHVLWGRGQAGRL